MCVCVCVCVCVCLREREIGGVKKGSKWYGGWWTKTTSGIVRAIRSFYISEIKFI